MNDIMSTPEDYSKLFPFDNEQVMNYNPSAGIIQGYCPSNYLIEACISSIPIPWRVNISCDIKNKQTFRHRCDNCPFAKYNGTYVLQASPRQQLFFDLIKTRNMREVERIGRLVGLQRGLCRTYRIDILKTRIVRIYVIEPISDDGKRYSSFAIFSITKDELTIGQIYRLSLLLCSDGERQRAFVCDRANYVG